MVSSTAGADATRESSGRAVFHRGSGSESRRHRETPGRGNHPTWVRTSTLPQPAMRLLVWRALVKRGDSQADSYLMVIPAVQKIIASRLTRDKPAASLHIKKGS